MATKGPRHKDLYDEDLQGFTEHVLAHLVKHRPSESRSNVKLISFGESYEYDEVAYKDGGSWHTVGRCFLVKWCIDSLGRTLPTATPIPAHEVKYEEPNCDVDGLYAADKDYLYAIDDDLSSNEI